MIESYGASFDDRSYVQMKNIKVSGGKIGYPEHLKPHAWTVSPQNILTLNLLPKRNKNK